MEISTTDIISTGSKGRMVRLKCGREQSGLQIILKTIEKPTKYHIMTVTVYTQQYRILGGTFILRLISLLFEVLNAAASLIVTQSIPYVRFVSMRDNCRLQIENYIYQIENDKYIVFFKTCYNIENSTVVFTVYSLFS